MTFRTGGNTTRMVIDETGNVGIGQIIQQRNYTCIMAYIIDNGSTGSGQQGSDIGTYNLISFNMDQVVGNV